MNLDHIFTTTFKGHVHCIDYLLTKIQTINDKLFTMQAEHNKHSFGFESFMLTSVTGIRIKDSDLYNITINATWRPEKWFSRVAYVDQKTKDVVNKVISPYESVNFDEFMPRDVIWKFKGVA